MKKIFYAFAFLAVMNLSTSCGGDKKEETKKEETADKQEEKADDNTLYENDEVKVSIAKEGETGVGDLVKSTDEDLTSEEQIKAVKEWSEKISKTLCEIKALGDKDEAKLKELYEVYKKQKLGFTEYAFSTDNLVHVKQRGADLVTQGYEACGMTTGEYIAVEEKTPTAEEAPEETTEESKEEEATKESKEEETTEEATKE